MVESSPDRREENSPNRGSGFFFERVTMAHIYPVYTIDAECQDCYKCVRRCPVKAIKVHDGHASVVPERCIACGKCVEVCPAKAKQVRNDTRLARELLADREHPVYLSLAPSWVSDFPGVSRGQMVRALRALGFAGVSETALGAQLISAEVAKTLDMEEVDLLLSSACPAAVDYVCKYLPELASRITPVGSPLMSHCRMLRDLYGDDIRVIFAGPCIAKKNEADRRPELLDAALTYNELREMFREASIDPVHIAADETADRFVPEPAEEGACYPIEGGMNDTIAFQSSNKQVEYITISGIQNLRQALQGYKPQPGDPPVFVETLACPGGCVHGPCTQHNSSTLQERLRVLKATHFPEQPQARWGTTSVAEDFPADDRKPAEPNGDLLYEALRKIGKYTPKDELNCDGCGYDTCRNFAAAMLAGNAEPLMCVSYLKNQAQKKANALLRSMPTGVVIVDKDLKIVECNRIFAALCGDDALEAFDAMPGMSGADLSRLVPFADLFASALRSGQEVSRDSYQVGKKQFNFRIFSIEPGETVGAVLFDMTNNEIRREHTAARAREIIERNIATVQEIVCRLGEQMADTELILRSIAGDAVEEEEKGGGKKA